MCYVLEAEPLVYLTKIIQGQVACYVLCVGGRAIHVSDKYYPTVGAALLCVLGIEPGPYLPKSIQGLMSC